MNFSTRSCCLQYNKNKGNLNAKDLNEEFLLLLRENGLIPEIPVPRKPRPAAEVAFRTHLPDPPEPSCRISLYTC